MTSHSPVLSPGDSLIVFGGNATPRNLLPDANLLCISSCLTTPVLKRGRCSPVADVIKTHPPPYVESVSEYAVYVFLFFVYICIYFDIDSCVGVESSDLGLVLSVPRGMATPLALFVC